MSDVPDVVAFALVVAVTVSAVALPVSALGGPTAGPTTETTMAADRGTDRVTQQTASNGTANGSGSLAPGQRLAGVVGVQGAEIDGELEERRLVTRVSRAESNESKAAVVATELNTARSRLQQLRETKATLQDARQSGDISRGEYRARMAVTAARIQAVRTQLDSSEAVSRDLPDAALEARGVNREELDRLRADADELRGPEVAEIAREVAGDDEGRELDPERGLDELPEPARDDKDDDESENGDDAGRPDDPGDEHGNDAESGNRSTSAGPPDDAGRSDEAGDDEAGDDEAGDDGAGNSGEAGNSGDSGDTGNSDDAENSDEAGNSSDSDDTGNSGDAGNSDDAGNSGDAGGGSGGGDDGDSDDGDSDDSPGNRGGNR